MGYAVYPKMMPLKGNIIDMNNTNDHIVKAINITIVINRITTIVTTRIMIIIIIL